ncbi:MAG: S8 family serine peptidase, partial [bacterium]
GYFNVRALRWYEAIDPYVELTGNSKDSPGMLAVLWDEDGEVVWLDTNQDRDFTDEKPMMDYAVRRDVGVIGHDVPATPRRESAGFTVQADKATKSVRLSLGVGWHATLVGAAAVAQSTDGGLFRAIASEAQLIPVDEGFFPHHLIDAAILAARSGAVDVICLMPMFVAVDVNPVGDGYQVAGVVLERLIARYQKLIFMPTGNAQGLNTVVDRASSPAVVAVGAYQS